MKVKLEKSSAISGVSQGLGAGAGMVLSKGVMGIAPAQLKTPIAKTVLGVALLLGSSAINGKGVETDVAKGLVLGAGVQQTVEGIVAFIKPKVNESENQTTLQKFSSSAFQGLNGSETESFYLPMQLPERPMTMMNDYKDNMPLSQSI